MSFLRDLRYSVRSLGRSPGLAAALLVTVAVGVGANATVAGFINGLLTRDLALPDASRLASIYWRDAGDRYDPVPYQSYLSLRQAASSFEGIAAFRESRANVTVNKHWAWMSIGAASPEIWSVAGVAPALGRMTFADEGHDTSSIGVVISHRVWRNEFGGRPDVIIGADITVNGRGGHVVGVAPEWFEGLYMGRAIDAWVPLDEEAAAKRPVWVLGRLRAKTALADAQGQVTEITGEKPGAVVTRYTGMEPEVQLKLTRLESLLGWAAALVFLTAAANAAGFLLSRAARRTHETATRIAVGATRLRLASHIVADGVVVSLGGAVLGVLVAFWIAGVLPALLYTEDAERLRLMPEPWQVAGSAAGYAAIMLLCSLAPIARIDKQGTMTTLRRTGEGAIIPVGWLRSLLVVAQMSVCVILVIGAALLYEGFRDALRTARGGQMGEPIVARLEAAVRFARPAEGQAYFQRSEHEVFGMRGVTSVAWVSTLPGGRSLGSTVTLERPAAGTREVIIDTVTPAGADLVKLTMKSGRPFAGRDGPFSCPVAIVNEAAADEYFEGRAVGRAMHDPAGRRIDIIGVADAVEKAIEPRIYFYERQALAPPSRDVMPRRFTVPISQAPPESTDIDVNVASSGYFDLVEASFPRGHGFDAASQANSCGVVVVNREAAQAYFDDDAVGGAVIDGDGSRSEIIGVVDAGALRVMQRRADPAVYFPMAQRYVPLMTLIAAAPAASPKLVAEITERLAAVPGGREPPKALTLEEHLARTSLGPERVATLLVTASALLALGLALLGVYGVMSDAVLQKKREIALKLALGAQARAIIAGVFRDGFRIAAAGGAAGLLLSWILVQWVLHANAGFQAPSWWVWLACPLILFTVVAIASVLPARWALAVDPITITRENG